MPVSYHGVYGIDEPYFPKIQIVPRINASVSCSSLLSSKDGFMIFYNCGNGAWDCDWSSHSGLLQSCRPADVVAARLRQCLVKWRGEDGGETG